MYNPLNIEINPNYVDVCGTRVFRPSWLAASGQARPHNRFEAIAAPSAIARNFLNEMSGSSLP